MQVTWNNALSRGDRTVKALAAAGLLLGVWALFLLAPENIPYLSCAFRDLTGHSCPTCGLTRSLHAASHGELVVSLRYHLMGPLVLTGILLASVLWSVEAATGKRIRLATNAKPARDVIAMFLIVWIVYWGIRLISEFVH
ncbi:MAG: DUF2752 domain-containing protein [Ignavibacteria bacterium]|nr:DUF2752 domain-containing protein [Ignavibacteria bacterium]